MQPGDILFGQLVTAEGITILEASSLCFIPPIYKLELIDFRKQLLRDKPRFTSATLCDWDIELIERYLSVINRVMHPQIPKLHNTDGEPLEMHRLVFDIESPEKVLDALKPLDLGHSEQEFMAATERTARGEFKRVRFNWKKPGNQMHDSWSITIVGHIEITRRRLVAEVNSANRALDGQTPLEAVGDPDGREKVMALVLEAERSARRMTPPVNPVTLRRVRERLGL
jgi:hypothetical protein